MLYHSQYLLAWINLHFSWCCFILEYVPDVPPDFHFTLLSFQLLINWEKLEQQFTFKLSTLKTTVSRIQKWGEERYVF